MDATAALLAGLAAGVAIAMQVGAVTLLLVEASVVGGPRAGVAAAMGVATADLAFGATAVAAGGAAGATLASHEAELRVVAALALAAIAAYGLVVLMRPAEAEARGARARDPVRSGTPLNHYSRFLAITVANPLTIASFAAVAAALSLDGPIAAAAFASGVGLASTAWHLAITVAAGHASRWLTPAVRRGLAIGGRIAVLAIAAHLGLSVPDA